MLYVARKCCPASASTCCFASVREDWVAAGGSGIGSGTGTCTCTRRVDISRQQGG